MNPHLTEKVSQQSKEYARLTFLSRFRLNLVGGLGVPLVGTVCLFLNGCSTTSPDSNALTAAQVKDFAADQEKQGHEEQAAAMADGEVTLSEYRKAFEDLSACLVDLGYPSPPSWTSPIDGHTTLFEMQDGGRTELQKEKDTAKCITGFWDPVSSVYQDVAPVEMDESLRKEAVACLLDLGYELDGSEQTTGEMAGPDPLTKDGTSKRWDATVGCVLGAQRHLFPEIPTASLTLR